MRTRFAADGLSARTCRNMPFGMISVRECKLAVNAVSEKVCELFQAAEALSLSSQLAGQAYFITNDDPRPFWEFVGQVLEGFGFPPKQRPHIWLPYYILMFIALACQYIVIPLAKPFKALELSFTPSAVTIAACTRQLSCRKAKEHFGYAPQVSIQHAQQLCFKGMPDLKYQVKGQKHK